MKGVFAALVTTSALTTVAYAEDKPVIGPRPAWVKPVAAPAAPAKADDAPVRLLLADQQVALEPGRVTVYSKTALKIQTPQGFQSRSATVYGFLGRYALVDEGKIEADHATLAGHGIEHEIAMEAAQHLRRDRCQSRRSAE